MNDISRMKAIAHRWNLAGAIAGVALLASAAQAQTIAAAPAATAPAGAIAAAASASSATQPGVSNTAEVADLAAYSKMVEALASDDFHNRDTAQKELDAMGWEQKALIAQLAGNTTDPEAKARLLRRVEAIEDQLAVVPPPISIDVKDATLGQVAAVLAKATGTPITASGGLFGSRYTLKASQKTFIEILKALNAQHPLVASGASNGQLFLSPANAQEEMAFTPGAAAFARQPAIPVGNMPPQLWIIYSLTLDPRIRIAQFTETSFMQAVDDKGNAIALNTPDANWDGGGPGISQLARMTVTPNLGTTLVQARGETTLTAIVQEQRLEVVDPAKHLNELFTLGKGATLALQQFELTDKHFAYQLLRSPSAAEALAAANAGKVGSPAELMISAVLVDAGGRTQTLSGTGGSVDGNVGWRQPVKLVLSVATRSKMIKVPFELKNVPLK